ncbi:MAG: polyphosphate kinase 1 [Phycisphaeraceae bacterium]|nr:polyphosphate kinase 1 [Phycisphaeraceae bacterium]
MTRNRASMSFAPGEEPSAGEFFNRELSWLEFNRRVLHEALDERTPLLERVGFLSIFNSNLDEFFQKRVGGLKRQIAAGVTTRTPDGMLPREQLIAIRQCVLDMIHQQADCYLHTLRPALAKQGIYLLEFDQLTEEESRFCQQYFRSNLFPVLTPLTVDPGHPFPFISNLSTSLGVTLCSSASEDPGGVEPLPQFARVKVPRVLPRWVRLPHPGGAVTNGGPHRFVLLDQIIRQHLSDLFEGMTITEVEPFRVTRNADVEQDEEDAEDLLELIEQQLRERRFGQTVRLEVDAQPSPAMTQFLMEELELDESDTYLMPALLDYTDLRPITDLPLPALKYEPWTPVVPPRLADEEADIFSIIRSGDVLVHHPYESFSASVEKFIRAAARDPKVIAIKQTLYRTSADSPFIPELIRAAESGKQVVCLVELKARFDEERNIHVAQALEKAGIHVVYGLIGLKTHTKTSLVVRHEADTMRVYAHIGTGNYNSKTANLYTDLGLFTCNQEITSDLVEMFHFLTGRSQIKDFRKLLIAPINMKRRFVELIDREIAQTQAWKARGGEADDPARPRIIAKMNSLEDRGVCRKLYDASRAGVRIQLIVRGFCCLIPGVRGMSENITVQSVIGRFLEHSRIYYFHNSGNGEYYIGSADWMYRNLNDRVECITPILEPALQQRLRQILEVMLEDRRQAWDLGSNGVYVQRKPDPARPETLQGTHQRLMEIARKDAQPAAKQ